MDPDQAAEGGKTDQESPQREASNEGEAHGHTVDGDRNAIVFSTTCAYIDDPVGCKIQEWISRVASRQGIQIKSEASERAIVMLLNVCRFQIRLDRVASPGRPDPLLRCASEIHRAALPSRAASAENVRRHVPALDTGAGEQIRLGCGLRGWLGVAAPQSRGQCDVGAGCVGVDDKHLRSLHRPTLPEGYP